MAVLYDPDSLEAKERVKWEAQYTPFGPGKRPYTFREYPKMLHKAGRPANGMGAHIIAEQIVVDDRDEEERYRCEGFRGNPTEALDAFEAQRLEFATLAAEMNYEQKHKLSEGASAEVEAARARHTSPVSPHMPVMPETPIKAKRGRKAKVKEQ